MIQPTVHLLSSVYITYVKSIFNQYQSHSVTGAAFIWYVTMAMYLVFDHL